MALGDETLRFALYESLFETINLNDKTIVDLGCGRGGGVEEIARSQAPTQVVGIDLSTRATAFATKRTEAVANLAFVSADVEALPFTPNSFDIALNVESSHCYPDRKRFYREAFSIIKQNGYFLYADFFSESESRRVAGDLANTGFEIEREEDITKNVVAALPFEEKRKRKLINLCPWWARGLMRQFSAVEGTLLFDAFQSGRLQYLSFVARKQ